MLLAAARGGLYALIALGFAVVFGSCRIINLFHGSFFLLGAYFAFFLSPGPDAQGAIAVAVTIGAGGLVGAAAVAYYFAFVRTFTDRPIRLMVVGLAANVVVGQAFLAAYGSRGAYVPPIVGGTVDLGSVRVLAHEVVVAGAALGLITLVWWLLRRSTLGLTVRAAADNAKGAVLIGIRPTRVLATTMAVSGVLAGLAGALAAPLRVVTPDMWTFALVKSFLIVIVGGSRSLAGTIGAAYALAALEVVVAGSLGEAGANWVSLMVVALVLVVRPGGLVGERDAR